MQADHLSASGGASGADGVAPAYLARLKFEALDSHSVSQSGN